MKKQQLQEAVDFIDEQLTKRFGEPYSGLHADISLGLRFALLANSEKTYIGRTAQLMNALDFIEAAVRRHITK